MMAAKKSFVSAQSSDKRIRNQNKFFHSVFATLQSKGVLAKKHLQVIHVLMAHRGGEKVGRFGKRLGDATVYAKILLWA